MNRLRPGLRLVLWGTIGFQVVLLAFRLVLDLRLVGSPSPPGGGIVAVLADTITMAIFPAVGIIILRRQPGNAVGWLFCLANVGWLVNTTVRSYVYLGVVAQPGSVPAPELVAWFYTWPGFVSSTFYVLLVLLFPGGHFLTARWRRVGRLTITVLGIVAIASAFAPGPLDPSLGVAMENPLGITDPWLGPVLYEASTFGYPIAILLLMAAIAASIQRYRGASGVERLQLKWFASGLGAWALLLGTYLVVAASYPNWDFPLWARLLEVAAHLGAGIFPIAAAVAILRYRLYDIDRIISRTLSYALLTAILVGVYVAGVIVLGSLARSLTGGGGGDLVVAASTLGVAAAFQPLRHRLRTLVDRHFNRARYDARRTVEDFARHLRHEVDLDLVADHVRETAQATIQPSHISIWFAMERTRPEVTRSSTDAVERSPCTTSVPGR